MNEQTIFFNQKIKETVRRADPTARIILFGSRARGDERKDSDWDILIIIDKDQSGFDAFKTISNPLYDLADDNGIEINPIIYTRKQWSSAHPSLFVHNVLNDGIEL